MFNIELARRNKRWTFDQLAAATRIHHHFLSLIERGQGIPHPDQAKRIALALDIPVETLLDTVEVKKSTTPKEPSEATA